MGKILGIVAIVLVVLCAVGGFLVYKSLDKIVDVAYAEGNCVDVMPTGAVAASVVPKPVACTDSKAVAKILKVADDKTAADGEEICGAVPGAVSYIQIILTNGSNKLLCLGPK